MEISVNYVGGRRVEVALGDHTVLTDQPEREGGEGTAPSPFGFFLASIAACAGYYVLDFCLTRDIPTDGIKVRMCTEKNIEMKIY